MWSWLKKNSTIIITVLVCVGFFLYCYGCEAKTRSLIRTDKRVNRKELQLELDQFISMAQIRMVDLDKQEQLRAVVLQNALILVQGQPLNPLGILTGIAAIYGVTRGGGSVVKTVKNGVKKRKVNNGQT